MKETADAWEDRLTDHLEGDLDPTEQAALERHLAKCEGCRRTLGELQAVRRWARGALPAEPATDPWLAVLRRIHPVDRRLLSRPALLRLTLAALLILGVGMVLRLYAPSSTPAPPSRFAPPSALGETEDAAAIDRLERIVEAGRHHLDPETLKTLEESLATIDAALARAEQALAEDPDNRLYLKLLEEGREQRWSVLRQAARRVERWDEPEGV